MRRGTMVVVLAAILLFAFFGWKAVGALALAIVILPLLAIAIVVVALWIVRQRLERKVEEVARAMQDQRGAHSDPLRRRDAIDVDATVRRPRDGADDPDTLEPR